MLRRTSGKWSKDFSTVIVGGGASGALVAGRLGLDNIRVGVLEEGADVTRTLKWHREAPAAPLLHKAAGRYIARREATLGDQKVTVELPSVVGGASVVLGSKAWIRGHELDWKSGAFPLPFEDGGLLLQYKRLEAVENGDVHRGTQGRFLITKAKGVSMIHRDILGGFQKANLGLVNTFNGPRGFLGAGAGRSEALIDYSTGTTCSSTNQYLVYSKSTMKRPITVIPKCKVTRLVFNGTGQATHVVAMEGGEEKEYGTSGNVVLAAGAINTPQILLNSNLPESTAAVLAKGSLWAVRTQTLQFLSNNEITLAPATNPIVKLLIGADWWWNRLGWMGSSYDDMLCLAESQVSRARRGATTGQYEAYPDLKIVVQPFMTTEKGALMGEHGIQFKLQLIRPTGRGSVDKEGHITLGQSEEDKLAFDEGVELVKKIAMTLTPHVVRPNGPHGTYDSWEGPFGGTVPLGTAVDPQTFKLVGTSNVFVTDGSLIPNPLVAESVGLSYALSDLCADKVARKAPSIL